MKRHVLTAAHWAKLEPLCLGKPGDPGRSGKDNRLFVEAVLWIVRTGSPWRDLPPSFGHWNSVVAGWTMWQTLACLGRCWRTRINPEHDPNDILGHLNALDQQTDDLAFGGPIRAGQAIAHHRGKQV